MWSPAPIGLYVFGDEHGVYAPRSSEHWKVTPDSGDAKPNVTVSLVTRTGGANVMYVSGGVSSPARIVQLWTAGSASTFPAASVASTLKVCGPTASWVYVVRIAHGEYGAESSEHSKVVPSSLAETRNVADVLVVVSGGARVIIESGAVVSAGAWTVQPWMAGEKSAWPFESTART